MKPKLPETSSESLEGHRDKMVDCLNQGKRTITLDAQCHSSGGYALLGQVVCPVISPETYLRFLRMVDSPRAPHLWEAIHDLSLSTIEVELAKYGYDVKELDCYKSWASHQPKRLTA